MLDAGCEGQRWTYAPSHQHSSYAWVWLGNIYEAADYIRRITTAAATTTIANAAASHVRCRVSVGDRVRTLNSGTAVGGGDADAT